MTLAAYHADMKRCSQMVSPIITDSLEDLASQTNERSAHLLRTMHAKRGDAPRLREYLLEQSFRACSDDEVPASVYTLGAAIELYNLSTYLVNWFIDKKGEIEGAADERRAVIQGMRLHEAACRTVRSANLPCTVKGRVLARFSYINDRLYAGQAEDLDGLNVHSGAHEYDSKTYLQKYLCMCHDKCGVFLGQASAMGADIAGASQDETVALQRFGNALGTGLQVVNDVSDVIPVPQASTIERPYVDQFSDVESGMVTPFVYALLAQDPSAGCMVGRSLDDVDRKKLFDDLLHMNAFDTSLRIGRYLQSYAKHSLNIFPLETRRRLSQSTSLLRSSKNHHVLRQDKGYVYSENLLSGTSDVLDEWTSLLDASSQAAASFFRIQYP